MSRINIDGLNIEFELLGELGAQAVVLTPGGRSSKDARGIRELGLELVARGKRALIWDRPNCGMSDVSFDGDSEGQIAARALCGLVSALDLGPTVLAAGSAGSRVSIEAAIRQPELFSHLAVWWVAGGTFCLHQIAFSTCCEPALIASAVGMQGLARSVTWAEQFARNPAARETLLAQDPTRFIEKMRQWMAGFALPDDSPIVGISAAELRSIAMPVLILRNSASDLNHPREVTDTLHRLIPHSRMTNPPWPDGEWNRVWAAAIEGRYEELFASWPSLADTIVEFANV